MKIYVVAKDIHDYRTFVTNLVKNGYLKKARMTEQVFAYSREHFRGVKGVPVFFIEGAERLKDFEAIYEAALDRDCDMLEHVPVNISFVELQTRISEQVLQKFIPTKRGLQENYVYILTMQQEPTVLVGVIETAQQLTWKQVTEEAVEYCKQTKFDLAKLAEHGCIREGEEGVPYLFPNPARMLIAGHIIQEQSKN